MDSFDFNQIHFQRHPKSTGSMLCRTVYSILCQTVIKLLGQASSGSVPVNILSELVLYSMPSVGFILLPMTLYVGIIVSLSRMSSDSEMVVMKSIGISGVTFMKIGLLLALITATFTAVNCLYLMPKATYEQKY